MTTQRKRDTFQEHDVTGDDVIATAVAARVSGTTVCSAVKADEADLIQRQARRHARSQRELPTGKPLLAPGPHGRAHTRPINIATLSPMERVLLPYHLRNQRTLDPLAAAQLRYHARCWAAVGFDDTTVQAWHDAEVSADQAGYLVQRGVPTDLLDLDLPVGVAGQGRMTVAEALAADMLPVEQIYDLLVTTGVHTPPPERAVHLPEPVALPTKTTAIPPVVFSHLASDDPNTFKPRPSVTQFRSRGVRRGR